MSGSPFISYAQNGEDVVLWRALGHVAGGRYVDVGAWDPTIDSVTRAFYERGWRGTHVEPAPTLAARIREERPDDEVVEAAITATGGASVTLHQFPNTGLNTLAHGIAADHENSGREAVDVTVTTTTLNDVLARSRWDGADIHFLKVDVEGLELEVLQSIDLRTYRPWILVVEATRPNSTEQSHAAWEPLVLAADYEFCLFDGLSRFYVASEHKDLRPLLSYPACVFDTFSRHRDLLREGEYAATRAELERTVAAQAADLLASRDALEAMHASHSWRVTAPLRRVSAALRR